MRKDERILWIGSYQSEEQFISMPIDNIGQASAYASQKGILKGLDNILSNDVIIDTINMVCYPSFPTYPFKKVHQEKWSRTGKSFDIVVGYRNTRLYKYYSREKAIYKAVKKWAGNENKKVDAVYVYAPTVGKIKAALKVKKKYSCSVFVIIPDVPNFVNSSASKIVHILKGFADKIMKFDFKYVDGFILYSKQIAKYYNFNESQWMLMEGIFDEAEIPLLSKNFDRNKKQIMYCGSLSMERGVGALLEAFHSIDDPECELLLVGKGDALSEIDRYSKLDSRIKNLGFINSRKEILKLESNANILIHLCDTNISNITYGFPSKMFEYLVSGAVVISPRVADISDEYYKYILEIKNMNAAGIKETILKAFNMSKKERLELVTASRKFILENRTSSVQARKILEFSGLVNKERII